MWSLKTIQLASVDSHFWALRRKFSKTHLGVIGSRWRDFCFPGRKKTVLANRILFALTVWINRLSRIAKTWYIARFSRHKYMAKQRSWRQTTKRPRLCYTNAYWGLGTDHGNWCKSPQKWVILVRAVHFRFSHLKSFNLVRGLNDDAAQLNGLV